MSHRIAPLLLVLACLSANSSLAELACASAPRNQDQFVQLAKLIFQKSYGEGQIGRLNLDYLGCYDPDDSETTGLEAHAGLDFHAPAGTEVYAPVSGYVINSCGTSVAPGIGPLSIFVKETEEATGYTFTFLHLQECLAEYGTYVHAGQLVAKSGSAGTSKPHLHLEIQPGRDRYYCGRGHADNEDNPNNCPANFQTPTPTAVVAAATLDPLDALLVAAFIHDDQQGLQLDRTDHRELTIRGLNFGSSGSLRLMAMTDDNGKIRWTDVLEIDAASWSDHLIEAQLLPNEFMLEGEPITIGSRSLDGPLLVQVAREGGRYSPWLPFPFKDLWNRFPWEFKPDWFMEPVLNLWRLGKVEGYKRPLPWSQEPMATGFYGNEETVKASELLKFLSQIHGGAAQPGSCTCDNSEWNEHWARPYLCQGLTLNWGVTCADDPERMLTRSEAARFIAYFSGIPSSFSSVADFPFTDVPVTDPNFREIQYGYQLGIFKGISEKKFGPSQQLNRAEAAKILKSLQGLN